VTSGNKTVGCRFFVPVRRTPPEGDLGLVPVHKHRDMPIIFWYDTSHPGQIINEVLALAAGKF